jgi:CheY-like chemotaxis protein
VANNRFALVVEDDAHNLVAMMSILKGMDIQFKRNTTGANVVQQARTLQPDFILLDMDLPVGDSFDICEAIQADPLTNHIPVIATADANLMLKLLPQIKTKPFATYLPRPATQRDLEIVLQNLDAPGRV